MWPVLPFIFQEHHGCGVAAFSLLQKPQAVAAELSRVVLDYGVGSVVSDDVVDSVAQEFDSAAFHKLPSLFI